MLFYYIRHGHPTYDPDALTARGREQADALVARFAASGLDRIFSSSSTRAIQTAEPTAKALGKEITVLDWCRELYAWNKLSVVDENGTREWLAHFPKWRELLVSPEVRALGHQWYTHEAFAGKGYGEEMDRIAKEADAFFAALGYRHDRERGGYIAERPTDERVALFAHQGFGHAFLASVMDVPYSEFAVRFDMGHTGVTVIDFDGKDGFFVPTMLQLSGDAHLFRAGLPLNYGGQHSL